MYKIANPVVLRRQWPRQKGTMVRILKRSVQSMPFPADFEFPAISTDEDQIAHNLQKLGLALEDNESEDNNVDEDTAGSFEIPKRSNLFLRASRASPGGLYLRTSRDPEMIPLSLRNGMLLRSFKR